MTQRAGNEFRKWHAGPFDFSTQNNTESVLTIGNGLFGLRGTYEEKLPYEQRGFFRSGTYAKKQDGMEVLANLPDISGIRLRLNGDYFHLFQGEFLEHSRTLDTFSHELERVCLYRSVSLQRFQIRFRRFFSLVDPRLFLQEVEIMPLDSDLHLDMEVGLDGAIGNADYNYIASFTKHVSQNRFMHASVNLENSDSLSLTLGILSDGVWQNGDFSASAKVFTGNFHWSISKKTAIKITKIVIISDQSLSEKDALTLLHKQGDYDSQLQLHRKTCSLSQQNCIQALRADKDIERKLNACFHHIQIMTPHYSDFSIGAKGLSGEGYAGHVFWDTEIFMFPYYLFTNPEIAKKLLLYRFMRLQQARENARRSGYDGAMFPWESATSGYDQTPEFSTFNIHTGKQTKIYSGIKELHVSADIMFAILQYYRVTLDRTFMEEYGKEMLEAITRFWLSKAKKTNRGYEILDVIGPDEYTEHVNNNYYTNFLVKTCIEDSLIYLEDQDLVDLAKDFCLNLVFPDPVNHILPQDDTFLAKPNLDIQSYRQSAGSQAILKDYSRDEVIAMQVLKQADTLLLFELFPDRFESKIKYENFHYYDQRTIHDSSLSKSTHAIVAFDLGLSEIARPYFLEALDIDFLPDSHSQKGIHAASMVRVFSMLFRGVLGIYVNQDGLLSICPKKQDLIPSFHLDFQFQGRHIRAEYQDQLKLVLLTNDPLTIVANNEIRTLQTQMVVSLH